MARRTGIDALIHVVAEQWCIGYTYDDGGESSDFRRFIRGLGWSPPTSSWTGCSSVLIPTRLSSPALEQRARADIRAAFVEHMGGETTVDAAALYWPDEHLPLPDPEAFARNLTAEELYAHRDEFGDDSREWIVAQKELRRRRGFAPKIKSILWGAAAVLVLAYWLWLRPLIWREG